MATSVAEYSIHRYIMHSVNINKTEFSYHIRHHEDVNHDMSLSKDHNNEDLYFNYSNTLILVVISFILYYTIINKVFRYKRSLTFIFILAIFVSLFYKISWDHLHYRFHMFHKVPYKTWNSFEKIAFHNHSYHHLQKGNKKGNYCIIFLGADHLFNTFNKCINNKDYCKKNYFNAPINIKKLCDKEEQNVKLDNGLKFCSNNID